MTSASVAAAVFAYSQMKKSDQDNILSVALHMLPVDLLVDMGTCILKKKMLAVRSVTPVENQLEMSCRFINTAPHHLQTCLVRMNRAGQSTPLQGQWLRIKTATCKHTKHLMHATNPPKNQSTNRT